MPVPKIVPAIFLLLFQSAVIAEGRVQETYAPATVDMELQRVSEHVYATLIVGFLDNVPDDVQFDRVLIAVDAHG